jgi:hypothetical protein
MRNAALLSRENYPLERSSAKPRDCDGAPVTQPLGGAKIGRCIDACDPRRHGLHASHQRRYAEPEAIHQTAHKSSQTKPEKVVEQLGYSYPNLAGKWNAQLKVTYYEGFMQRCSLLSNQNPGFCGKVRRMAKLVRHHVLDCDRSHQHKFGVTRLLVSPRHGFLDPRISAQCGGV